MRRMHETPVDLSCAGSETKDPRRPMAHGSSTVTDDPNSGGAPNNDAGRPYFFFTLANKCIALYCYVPKVARLSRNFPNMTPDSRKVGGKW